LGGFSARGKKKGKIDPFVVPGHQKKGQKLFRGARDESAITGKPDHGKIGALGE